MRYVYISVSNIDCLSISNSQTCLAGSRISAFSLPVRLPSISSSQADHHCNASVRASAADRLQAKMDPQAFKSTMSDLNFNTVLAAAARDYQKEMIEQEKARVASSAHEEVDLDDLLNDPELESLHAERIAALKQENEKRQALERKGHGEYRDVREEDFLAEVTGSDKVVCHFYHHEFVRCKIIDKHLKILASKYFDTKFIRVDAENAPFFVTKLAIKTLPCVILFRDGVAFDRLVGFQDLGGVDDFSTGTLEKWLLRKAILVKSSHENESERAEVSRRIRSTTYADSDSD